MDYNSDSDDDDDDGSFSRIEVADDANELACEIAEESKQMVEVQLPPNFGVSPSGSAASKEVPVYSSSLSGSMVKVSAPGKAAVPDHDASEASEWSVIASSRLQQDDSSVAASSAISGFDVISLNGSSKKRCNFCSFLNHEEETICRGCDKALVANPCLTVDEKLARDLQLQEEEAAFRNFQEEENQRTNLAQQPLLIRGQILADDILSALESCRLSSKLGNAFSGLPRTRLTLLASSFLECIDQQRKGKLGMPPVPFKLCYCFTEDSSVRLNLIHAAGFGSNAQFGSTPEAAPPNFSGINDGQPLHIDENHQHQKRTNTSNRDYGLCSILEHGAILEDNIVSGVIIEEYDSVNPIRPGTHKGWIAAIVNNLSFESSTVLIKTGTANIYRQPESMRALPLVSFDAKRLLIRHGDHDDLVQHLTDILTGVFLDFFCKY